VQNFGIKIPRAKQFYINMVYKGLEICGTSKIKTFGHGRKLNTHSNFDVNEKVLWNCILNKFPD
jgi:hypothetical protein